MLISDDHIHQTVRHVSKCPLKFCAHLESRHILHLMFVLTFLSGCTVAYSVLYAHLVVWLVWKSKALINDILLYSI